MVRGIEVGWGVGTMSGLLDPTSFPRFGAAKAFAAVGLLLFAQLVAGVWVIVAAMLFSMAGGASVTDTKFMDGLVASSMTPTIGVASLVSMIVAYVIARFWAWHLVIDPTDDGLGVRRVPARRLVLWFLCGAVLAAVYLGATQWLPPSRDVQFGPISKIAAAGGSGRLVWMIVAIFFAPVTEEVFFRGLILRGLRESWGIVAAGAVVTVIFVSMHLTETLGYWPATVAISAMALVTLAARLLSKSLAAPIAVHVAYNTVITCGVYLLT